MMELNIIRILIFLAPCSFFFRQSFNLIYSMVNKSVSATSSNKCAAFDRADESFHLALCAQTRIGRLAVFSPALVEDSLIRIR